MHDTERTSERPSRSHVRLPCAGACNIQAVARRTGIPSATLREWEQRYGVLKPERTAGSHRRYTERDVLRVEWLKARLEEGYRIGEAARLLGGYSDAPKLYAEGLVEALVAGAVSPVRHASSAPSTTSSRSFRPSGLRPRWSRRPSGGLGDAWEQGKATVAHEHQLTEVLRGKMRGLLNGALGGPRGRIVLCCAPGERHEAGLLAVAVLLHADGWQVIYLGGGLATRGGGELRGRRGRTHPGRQRDHARCGKGGRASPRRARG